MPQRKTRPSSVLTALVLLPCILFAVAACGGATTDSGGAGESQSASERVQAEAGRLCADYCSSVEACFTRDCVCGGDVCDCSGGPPPGDCASECTEQAGVMAAASEACAQAILDLFACAEREGCDALEGQTVCAPSGECATADSACSEEMTAIDSLCHEPTAENPPATAGVVCQGGFGAASVAGGPVPPPDGVGGGATFYPTQLCHEGRDGCSDGSTYEVRCMSTPSGSADCTCIRDGVLEAQVMAPGPFCSDWAVVDASCGWQVI